MIEPASTPPSDGRRAATRGKRGTASVDAGSFPTVRSETPLVEQLPVMMQERGVSINRLAREVGVSQSYLSRVLRRAEYKTPSGELAARIAAYFGLPADWFPETRQARLFALLRTDGELRERLYDELVTEPSRRRAAHVDLS